MNILFLSESYYPQFSGVPVVVQYLAEGLTGQHHVSVATSIAPNDKLPFVDEQNGVKIFRFVIYRNIAKRLRGDLKGLQQFVLRGQYDVIVIECGQAATTDALLPIMKDIKAPCVLHAHGLSGLLGRPFAIKSDLKHTIGNTYNWLRMQRYYGYTFKRQCKHFAASISLTATDSGYNYLAKHITKNYVLGNAAEDMFFEQTTNRFNLPTDGMPYLISIANYQVVKNQLNMLRQFYLSTFKFYALVMIGRQKNEYYNQVVEEKKLLDKRYGERNVVMLTGIPRRYFPSILDNATAYLVTSTTEQFSISIIEAMARSVPFISTNVGNAKELPGGIVVDDVHDMHTAIDTLLSNENRRRELGAEAREYAFKHCRRLAAVDKLEMILNEVISNKV